MLLYIYKYVFYDSEIDFFIPSLPWGRIYRGTLHRGIYGRSFKGADSFKQVGKRKREKKSTSLREVSSLWIWVEYTSRGHKGISLVHLNVTRSHSGEVKNNLWQELFLSPWSTWSPEQGPHSLFVLTPRNQENMKFWNFMIHDHSIFT